MISTKSPNELPHPAQLREVCQAIALLDEIMQPDASLRTYAYDANWAEHEELASMRSGEGEAFFVWFSPAGVVIRGNDPTCSAARAKKRPDSAQLFDGIPDALASARTEPAFGGEDEVTFAIWRAANSDAWTVGKRARGEDGSARLLAILEAHPLNYIEYAQKQYGRKLPMAAVEPFYQRRTITPERIRSIREDADVASIVKSAAALGFDTAEGKAAPQKAIGAATPQAPPPPSATDVGGDAEFSVVRDGRRTKLVIGGRVHAWNDDADAFERIRDFARAQLATK